MNPARFETDWTPVIEEILFHYDNLSEKLLGSQLFQVCFYIAVHLRMLNFCCDYSYSTNTEAQSHAEKTFWTIQLWAFLILFYSVMFFYQARWLNPFMIRMDYSWSFRAERAVSIVYLCLDKSASIDIKDLFEKKEIWNSEISLKSVHPNVHANEYYDPFLSLVIFCLVSPKSLGFTGKKPRILNWKIMSFSKLIRMRRSQLSLECSTLSFRAVTDHLS